MALSLLGHKTVYTEIEIPAPPSEVWKILTDAARYSEWNPVIIAVEGEYGPGETLSNTVRETSGKESLMKSKVIGWKPEQELNQFGGLRGILTFDHKWQLAPIPEGTQVIQREEYRGVGVWFWDASWVEPAYARANQALKERVLSLRQASE